MTELVSIYTANGYTDAVAKALQAEDRLSDLVALRDSTQAAPRASGNSLIVDSRGILQPIDWHNTSPPYLLSNPLPFQEETLLGLIFSQLDNGERAWFYLEDHPLLQFDIGMMNRLRHGLQIDMKEFTEMSDPDAQQPHFESYRIQHNAAIVRHYGYLDKEADFQVVEKYYQQALEGAPNAEYRAFTTKHYATLLLDAGALAMAEQVLENNIRAAISDDAKFGLKAVLSNVWMKQLAVPYDPALLAKLKDTLWETLQFFEANGRKAEAALLLMDAAQIANFSQSFAEALGYISKAIRIFTEEGLEELAGNAFLGKGTLLYTWAQNGNPQFYKPAIESYQEALKVFRQDVAPDVFADIHLNLAVLYSEMPADIKKKGIWAGVASASFQEALNFYTKERYPYEYGMICNNYGNALTKFPPAVHSDNYEKSLYYYQEALSVRTLQYPYERAITLLNFLEASWNVSNHSEAFNRERYEDMVAKAQEVKTLEVDAEMLREADNHLEMLEQLKQVAEKA